MLHKLNGVYDHLDEQGRLVQCLSLNVLSGLVEAEPLGNLWFDHRVLLELDQHQILQLLQVLLVRLQR